MTHLVRKLLASAASGRALLRREALLSLVLLPAAPRLSSRPAAVARSAFMRPARALLGPARPLGPAAGRLSLAFLRASGRRGAGAGLGLRLRLPPGAGGSRGGRGALSLLLRRLPRGQSGRRRSPRAGLAAGGPRRGGSGRRGRRRRSRGRRGRLRRFGLGAAARRAARALRAAPHGPAVLAHPYAGRRGAEIVVGAAAAAAAASPVEAAAAAATATEPIPRHGGGEEEEEERRPGCCSSEPAAQNGGERNGLAAAFVRLLYTFPAPGNRPLAPDSQSPAAAVKTDRPNGQSRAPLPLAL